MREPTSHVPFSQRLSTRVAAVFLLLLVILGVSLVLLLPRAFDRATEAADQALNRDLASFLAPRFQPHLETDIDSMAIQSIIDQLTMDNRRIDVYLLGSDGMIKEWFTDARSRPLMAMIPTRPLEAFLAGADLPIRGVDPARMGVARPFSVAPIRIMGEEGCYLYLILQNERYDAVAGVIRSSVMSRAIWQGLALALLLTALAGVFLFGRITRRVSRLRETVARFEGGEMEARAAVDGHDEVAGLSQGFNTMAERIQAQVDALRRNDALRRELVANVSHDLRSPLAALRGYLETLDVMADRIDSDDRANYVRQALRSSDRLSRLVSDLFDLARFDAAEIQPTLEPSALPELAHDVTAELQVQAQGRGVTLRPRSEAGLPLVRLDAALVERALANLIDNALRHTPSGGTVDVEVARADGQTVSVSVRDTGEGIASHVLPRVFERFVRADPSRSGERGGGAGLGLAIVQRIARLHGGSVRVESVLGRGATFTLTLPVDGPSDQVPAAEAIGTSVAV